MSLECVDLDVLFLQLLCDREQTGAQIVAPSRAQRQRVGIRVRVMDDVVHRSTEFEARVDVFDNGAVRRHAEIVGMLQQQA